MRVGIVGCGNVSDIYLENGRRFPNLRVEACADLDVGRATAKAAQYGVPRACEPDDLLADRSIELVINLTPPKVHFDISRRAIDAGKHVYTEKPLATTREEGARLLAAAGARGVRIGGAPDTFLGASLQTCRRVIDSGEIGEPVAATAFMMYPGHESWHPDPEFFYQPGGGPLFDMGPYYITALVSLLGPVRSVTAATKATHAERVVGSGPKKGARFKVNVPTHVAGLLEFAGGTIATILMSFDGWYHQLPLIEIYGARGSVSLPDPNQFGGPVRVRPAGAGDWREAPCRHGYAGNSRALGAADMAAAIAEGRLHRASGELIFHVLDVMQALHEAGRARTYVDVESRCARPEPMKEGLAFGEL